MGDAREEEDQGEQDSREDPDRGMLEHEVG
jgi:hypothetical protein